MDLNLGGGGAVRNINIPAGVNNLNLNLQHNNNNIPLLRATLVQASDPNVFVIPQMWKRIVAEVLDFLILFVLKIMITFIAVDAFDLVDLENYDLPVAFDLLNMG